MQTFYINMNRSTVTKILFKKEKWLSILSTQQDPSTVCQRSVKYPKLNKAMELWVKQAIAMNLLRALILKMTTFDALMDGYINSKNGLIFTKLHFMGRQTVRHLQT